MNAKLQPNRTHFASGPALAIKVADSAYAKWGKRALDVLASMLGLLVLSPVFVIVGFSVKLMSPGPLFYRQIRLGKGGRQFQILKFRSMVSRRSGTDLGITVSGDNRVTQVGRVLRCYKLDELPQLWNVLRGDMSLVGPRPELPRYVAGYTVAQREVLAVRPGITDPASLSYRHEEEMLAKCDDPETFYQTHILPDKLKRSLLYTQSISLRNDIHIIFKTLITLICPSREEEQHF